MKAVWFNQLDFGSLCRTSRVEMARALAAMGHSLKIIGRYRCSRPRFPSLKPRPLLVKQLLPDPAGGILFQLQALFLATFETFKKVDLIMVDHFCVPTMLPFSILSRAGLIRTKFVLDIRSCPTDTAGMRYAISRWRYNLSIRWANLFYDGITVITDLYRKDISSRFGVNPMRIGVWSSGVFANVFDPGRVDTTRIESIKCGLRVRNRLVIMYHGVLSAYRGLQKAVKALSLLNTHDQQQVVLILVGDGPAGAEIRSLGEAQGVEDAIRVVDAVPYEDVPNYLSVCHAGILPFPAGKWWGMSSPLKLMEYLAMEKPVILTDIPAHRAVMRDCPCAFYMQDNSPATIARAIRTVAGRKALLPQVGKQGRTIVLEEFTWEKQARNLLDYARRLCRREGS